MIRRPARLWASAGALTVLAFTPGCSNSAALGLARQACVHVNRAVTLYDHSLVEAPAARNADQQKAVDQLEEALPSAATAAGEQPQWQALMTDLSEVSRVPVGNIIPSLHLQCQVADSPGGEG